MDREGTRNTHRIYFCEDKKGGVHLIRSNSRLKVYQSLSQIDVTPASPEDVAYAMGKGAKVEDLMDE